MMHREQRPHITIEAKDLVVSYGKFEALNIPYARLEGNVIAVIGHNGSGKSTFLKTVLKLLEPSQGSVECFNAEGDSLVPELDMAFAPEEGAVFADLAVKDYFRIWCQLKQNDEDYYKHQGASIIDEFELGPLMEKKGSALSKGQRRRVQTAIGFIANPNLFIFDEPFDGLDVKQTVQLAEIIQDKAVRIPMIISSHRMEVVERVADTVIVLKDSNVVAEGKLDKVSSSLCGKSIYISSNNGDVDKLLSKLSLFKETYSNCLVSRLGSSISITGKEIEIKQIESFLVKHCQFVTNVSESAPSLVDAMNFFLQLDDA